MITHTVDITPTMTMGSGSPLVVIAGPCVIESRENCLEIGRHLKDVCERLELSYIFKASFDKANRTSLHSYRGPGLEDGLACLAAIREELGVPVLTDIHEPAQAEAAARVVDVLQIPAFLCRQTDLILAAGQTGLPVSVKKGQFLAPEDMAMVLEKIRSTGNERIILTERGSSFGYHNLVVDMRSLVVMAQLGIPVVFDATHAVQLPGGQGTSSGGQRDFVVPLARAAAAVGIHGLFLEVHPAPEGALSDGANSLPLSAVEGVLKAIKGIHELGD